MTGVATTIARELTGVLAPVVETFHRINPKPTASITYPYSTFEFSYRESASVDGGATFDVELEIDMFDRGSNTLRLLETEDAIVEAFKRLRKINPAAYSRAKLEQALDVPTLVDGLYRRQVQINITMTLREKV